MDRVETYVRRKVRRVITYYADKARNYWDKGLDSLGRRFEPVEALEPILRVSLA